LSAEGRESSAKSSSKNINKNTDYSKFDWCKREKHHQKYRLLKVDLCESEKQEETDMYTLRQKIRLWALYSRSLILALQASLNDFIYVYSTFIHLLFCCDCIGIFINIFTAFP
jgi:hypothetical protein